MTKLQTLTRTFALLALAVAVSASAQSTISVNITSYSSYCTGVTVCLASIQKAINDAKVDFATAGHQSDTYTLHLNTSAIDLSNLSGATGYGGGTFNAPFDVSGISPASGGMFTILGQGRLNTTITVDNTSMEVYGKGVSNINISGMTFVRTTQTVTQGSVYSVSAGHITLRIPAGYILPSALYAAGSNGRYLRVYDDTPAVPPSTPETLVLDNSANNTQTSFGGSGTGPSCTASTGGTSLCDFTLDNTSLVLNYAPWTNSNAVVGVKSEGTGAQAYYFNNTGLTTGNNVGFTNVRWQDSARGNWRNITGGFVRNCYIVRRDMVSLGYQLQAMSTAGGGPQFGYPNGTDPISGIVIDGFSAESTGDDSIAIFNDTTSTSTIEDVTAPIKINDSFARTINLNDSCYVNLNFDRSYLTNCSPNVGDNKTDYTPTGCITNTTPSQCTMP